MEVFCDNTSVGVIIENENDEVLLLGRARFPFGLAPPAGHIDDHGSAEQAAVEEVFEEVGLRIAASALETLIANRRVENICRRTGGDHHNWTVSRAMVVGGLLLPSVDETLGASWVSRPQLQKLANNVPGSGEGLQPETIQPGAQLLEPIWLDFLTELGYID